jgi:hypothetical protein
MEAVPFLIEHTHIHGLATLEIRQGFRTTTA